MGTNGADDAKRALAHAWVCALACAVSALAFGCEADPPQSGVYVLVDAEGPVVSAACRMDMIVYGGRGALGMEPRETRSADRLGPRSWPISVGLVPEGGDASRLWGLELRVYARGSSGSCDESVVLSRSVRGNFVRGQVKLLTVLLESSCLDVDCTSGGPFAATCLGGACLPVPNVRVETLPEWDPEADAMVPQDAGAELDAFDAARDAIGDANDEEPDALDARSGMDAQTDGAITDATSDDALAMDASDGARDTGSSDGGSTDAPSDAGDSGRPSDGGGADSGPSECRTPTDCDDGAACTDDFCTDGTCAYEPHDSRCTGGTACTTGRCVLGGAGCVYDPIDCSDGIACTRDSCTVGPGCASTPDSTLCMTGFTCTPGVGCTGGACVTPADCADDGDACTVVTCTSGVCSYPPVTCPDDGNPCTDDVCAAGACYQANDDGCDDADQCTTNDRCTSGACLGSPRICDDGNACTLDACDAAMGCTAMSVPDGTSCGPGQQCCTGVCSGVNGTPFCGACGVTCGINQMCMVASCQCTEPFQNCDVAPGCESNRLIDPNNCGVCGLACPGGSCSGGMCGDAGSGCGTNECFIAGTCHASGEQNPANQCEECQPPMSPTSWTPRSGACDDGLFCTINDMCMGAFCTGMPRDCDGAGGFCIMSAICIEATNSCDVQLNPNTCFIADVCYSEGQPNPGNTCERCDSSMPLVWSNVPNGTGCNVIGPDAGLGMCVDGMCVP